MLVASGFSSHRRQRQDRGKMSKKNQKPKRYSLVILLTSNNVNVDECSAVLRFLPSQNYEIDDARYLTK